MANGKFITFEGTDGSGKTSIIKEIVKRLEEDGFSVVVTREPGGVKISEEIRDVIHDVNNTEMDPICEALLYAASRRQHLVQKVMPLVNDGKIVICDRYIDSSLAYQGYARGIGIEKVKHINDVAIDNTYPDLTILLDVTPEVGLSRIKEHLNTHEFNRLDRESIDFHKKTYEGYHIVASMFKDRIKVIDGERSINDVSNDVYKEIIKCING